MRHKVHRPAWGGSTPPSLAAARALDDKVEPKGVEPSISPLAAHACLLVCGDYHDGRERRNGPGAGNRRSARINGIGQDVRLQHSALARASRPRSRSSPRTAPPEPDPQLLPIPAVAL